MCIMHLNVAYVNIGTLKNGKTRKYWMKFTLNMNIIKDGLAQLS